MFAGLDDGPLLPRKRKIKAPPTETPIEQVFSTAHASDARRARAWLKDRIAKAARLPESELLHESVDVTPALAEIILAEHNKKNRALTLTRVKHYADIIRNGLWTFHSQGISLARDGTLINGQHRLSAIVMAGMTVRMSVTFNEDPAAFLVMDTGKARTGSDALAVEGGYKNTTILAAAARVLKNINLGGRGNIGITNHEVVATIEDAPELEEWAAPGKRISRKVKNSGTAGPTVALYLIAQHSKCAERLGDFIEQLAEGVIPKKNPILALRENLANGELLRHRINSDNGSYVCACMIKAWNLWIKGRVGSKTAIQWDDELFPMPE